MPRATFVVELDIDQDGTYGTVFGTDVKSATIFRGRDNFMDSAREGHLSVALNNSLGKYSPRGPNVVTENSVALTTLVPIRVRTTSPVVAIHFTGIITSISVDPNPKQQQVTLEATDSMIVLQRAIIYQRLMQSKSTGIIINRLIDAAEGELVSNPAFDENLSGYSVISGGGTSRLASGEILEGQSVMRVTAPSAIDGVRYTLPSQSGKTIGAAAYIINDTSSPGSVALKINQSSGGALGSTVLALAGYWQRLAQVASGSFSGGTPYLDIQAVGGPGTFRVGALHAVESKLAIPRNIDLGNTRLPYYGPFRAVSMNAIEEVRDNELGGLFHINGGGTARFEQRTARFLSTASLGTIDEIFWGMDYTDDAEDRVSKISFSYGKPELGAPATYIWELELPNSRRIAPSSTESILANYGALAKDVVKPVANTDYMLNSQPDGSGVDMTGTAYGTFTWVPYGMGARFQFVNGTTTAYITQLAIRAT